MNAMVKVAVVGGAAAVLLCACPARGQESRPAKEPEKAAGTQPPASEKPAEAKPPEPKPETKKPPTLDDLLGLPKEKGEPKGKARPEAADPSKTELNRKLSAKEVSEQFKVAVELMGETAERLSVSRDTGLATQRMQEDILRKLDQMIKQAEQNQKQSKSKQQQQQQQQDPGQSKPQQARNPEGHQPAPDTMEPPAGSPANPNPGVAARGAAWGNLPERVREALLQGNADKYSALYQRWTEQYYRRLAEEANK